MCVSEAATKTSAGGAAAGRRYANSADTITSMKPLKWSIRALSWRQQRLTPTAPLQEAETRFFYSMSMGSRLLVFLAAAISLVQVTVSVELHLVKINKTWSEAQSYCRENYTDLVSIRSAQEVENINTTVQDVQTERVWIGLFRNNTSQQWQWSNGDYFMYLNWYQHAAQYITRVAVFNTQWYGLLSSYPFYFMCQKVSERDNSALKGYYLVEEFKSWINAQQHCRNDGSELASIRSPEEQEALNTLTDPLSAETAAFVWIGLYRENSSQPWKWSNGDPIEKWDSGDPDLSNTQDACVSMNGNASGRALGFWDDRSCTERFYFLCYGGQCFYNGHYGDSRDD
ncbi:secretory phospholipase A2 receptor-like [Acipenser oxyrinchus oxyrinchus]|uniref:Secretory phospholipase A2 receptor-like n=1 Tax=Acipenser oxyrinchus oxyrinchus TaxID=40147 RepID=A0AAD8G2W5_ACIOX|nr:secretory phospholipase A2 receptor-like [Acipenser oxyrinchus oxyrinchus]